MLGNHNYRLNLNPLVVSQNDKGLLDAAALAGSIYDFVAKNSKEKKAAEERQQRYDDLYDMYLKQTGQIPLAEDMTYDWSSDLPDLDEDEEVETVEEVEPVSDTTLNLLLGGKTGYVQPLQDDDQYRKYLNLFGGNNG